VQTLKERSNPKKTPPTGTPMLAFGEDQGTHRPGRERGIHQKAERIPQEGARCGWQLPLERGPLHAFAKREGAVLGKTRSENVYVKSGHFNLRFSWVVQAWSRPQPTPDF
jgi:hypothetical protein